MPKPNLTVHMMVKNEDRFVRYSLLSVLPYASVILITDTGSTDHTIEAIKSINSPKIKLTKKPCHTPAEVTHARLLQLQSTPTDWFWVVDGDEIYPEATAKELVSAINSSRYHGVSVRRYDLLGDLYHRQKESIGSYHLWGITGHLVLRALKRSAYPDLTLRGDYPNEGYYTRSGAVIDDNPAHHYVTNNYLYHAMYLRRSSLGSNLSMFNRGKYKVETGLQLTTPVPEVFHNYPPLSWEGDPLRPRTLSYNLVATVLTPLKNLKRRLI